MREVVPTKQGNIQYRDWIRAYVGNRRFDELVVQTWFSENRPELSLMWMDIKFTPSQLQDLESIEIPRELHEEIRELQTEVMKNAFHGYLSEKQIEEMIGEPYLVKHPVLAKEGTSNYRHYPDMESFRMLRSPYVQKELACSIEQTKKIGSLYTQYRKQKWTSTINPEDMDFGERTRLGQVEKAKAEQQTRIDLLELLDDEQWLRLRQITNHRYFVRFEVRRMMDLMGYPALPRDELGELTHGLGAAKVNMDGVSRILLSRYVGGVVGGILGEEQLISEIMGKPSVLNHGTTTTPNLEDPVLKELMKPKKSKNPRRRGR